MYISVLVFVPVSCILNPISVSLANYSLSCIALITSLPHSFCGLSFFVGMQSPYLSSTPNCVNTINFFDYLSICIHSVPNFFRFLLYLLQWGVENVSVKIPFPLLPVVVLFWPNFDPPYELPILLYILFLSFFLGSYNFFRFTTLIHTLVILSTYRY